MLLKVDELGLINVSGTLFHSESIRVIAEGGQASKIKDQAGEYCKGERSRRDMWPMPQEERQIERWSEC